MEPYILIDYYNLPRKIISGGVVHLVSVLDSVVSSVCPDAEEVVARLYGGWYDHSGLTREGTRLTQEIDKNFPKVLRRTDGARRYVKCEIASSLVCEKGEVFVATVRPRYGMDRFGRRPAPSGCIDSANCTIPTVHAWSRRGCPKFGCPVGTTQAFVGRQQKLVDTLLSCDLVSLASAGQGVRLFLVSEDDDFIPALLMARSFGASVWHVRTKPNKGRLYDLILQRKGIGIVNI